MNNTKTPTAEKKIFPLRLPPDLYKKVRNEVQNEKDSYYIVNYDDNEVYITKGYDGKYKLSEMM